MSEKRVFVFGLHAVESLLTKQSERVQRLCVLQERGDQKIQSLIQLAKTKNIKVEFASRSELDHIANGENHQGALAFCHAPKHYSENDLEEILDKEEKPFLLILDGVQDPHNLGACLRSADAAGVHAVIAPRDKAVGLTSTVSKVASGAAEVIPFIQVTNLARTLRSLQERGIWIYGAAGEADKNLFEIKLTGPLAIVLGAEGSGLRRLTRDHCDMLIKIPMQGSVSSLNVSVATGVFLFEAVRQRTHGYIPVL
jgi:23S rRNA (guanosine2251-2'-O)-methyltransferase